MKTKVSPTVVGLFVLGAFVLGLVALFSFGSINLFSKPQRFVVLFDESIHGLDLGSPVKLRGVRVGRVVGLKLRYVTTDNKTVVAVVCELNRNTLTDERGAPLDVSEHGQLQTLIDRGLRAQLGVLGLATGLLYVEMDFFDPADYPAGLQPSVAVDFTVVPAVPSTISEFQASFSEILADVKRIDFQGLGRDLRGLLVDARRKINDLDTAGLTAEWTQAGRSVNELLASGQIDLVLQNLNATLADVRTTLAKIDGAVEPTAEGLQATLQEAQRSLASIRTTAEQASRFVQAQGGLGAEVSAALQQVGAAAEAVARLADYLERNPSALISGRARQP